MKIKVNDNVLVAAGKDKGKTGKVLKIVSKKDQIVVEKVNIRTKHVRKSTNHPGEKVRYEAGINVSNVMLVCPQCKKATRVGYQVPKEGKKVRVCKKCSATVDQSFSKKQAKS